MPDEAGMYGYKNPRDLYGRMHSGYFYCNPEKNRAGYIPNGAPAPKGSILVIPNSTDPSTSDIRNLQEYVLLYNKASPSFSFVVNYANGQMFGAGVLIESLGDSAQQFVDEVENAAGDFENADGEIFISQVVNAAFGDEAMAMFEIYQV
jgi:hypothetical protein